jgi:hypothetical protein
MMPDNIISNATVQSLESQAVDMDHLNLSSQLYLLDVRGSVHNSIFHKENPTRCNILSNILISYLYELNMFRATHRPPSGN